MFLSLQLWQQQLVALERKMSEIESSIEGEADGGVAGEGRGLTGGNMQKRMLK